VRRLVSKRSISLATCLSLLIAGVYAGAVGVSGQSPPYMDFKSTRDYPAFELVREIQVEKGTEVLHLKYDGTNSWTESTVDSKDAFKVGRIKEVRDGKYRTVMYGSSQEAPIGSDELHIPGPWFITESMAFNTAVGAGFQVDVVTEDSTIALRIEGNGRVSEHVFDRQTGLPLEYREFVNGINTLNSRVTSLQLDSGQRIR
jgi:hypothetical protein